MTGQETPIYEPGDVVYGVDPYKGAEAARPWLIISNHEGRPFHGEQYITLSLTTRTWMDGLLGIEEDEWSRGDTPDDSRIIPWGSNHSVAKTSVTGKGDSKATWSPWQSTHSLTIYDLELS